jgi:hypothetical protein
MDTDKVTFQARSAPEPDAKVVALDYELVRQEQDIFHRVPLNANCWTHHLSAGAEAKWISALMNWILGSDLFLITGMINFMMRIPLVFHAIFGVLVKPLLDIRCGDLGSGIVCARKKYKYYDGTIREYQGADGGTHPFGCNRFHCCMREPDNTLREEVKVVSLPYREKDTEAAMNVPLGDDCWKSGGRVYTRRHTLTNLANTLTSYPIREWKNIATSLHSLIGKSERTILDSRCADGLVCARKGYKYADGVRRDYGCPRKHCCSHIPPTNASATDGR